MYNYNVNVAVGNAIRKYREARNLTQEMLAEQCGISHAYFGRIERGEYNVTVDKCQKIADALGIRLADLFDELE
jgi:transcriptional regulator with XRE-family HTH domain